MNVFSAEEEDIAEDEIFFRGAKCGPEIGLGLRGRISYRFDFPYCLARCDIVLLEIPEGEPDELPAELPVRPHVCAGPTERGLPRAS